MDTIEHTDYSYIVGVFRDRAKAEQALEALKQAGIGDEPPQLTIYPQNEVSADAAHMESEMRALVHVRAEGREQDAVEILIRHGSNNADLPTGTELVHGSIVRSVEAAGDKTEAHAKPEGGAESFFGAGQTSHDPKEINVMDNSNFPHG